MNIKVVALAVGTVVGLSLGQILFKLAASRGGIAEIAASPVLWAGLVLYAAVTGLWVLLLREVDLSRAYPVVAATYAIVPVASVVFLGERLGPFYGPGVALIILGIVLVMWT
jgi:undecaprenyl phosphate-alpha-L-ara4N flippase subunit ArnE